MGRRALVLPAILATAWIMACGSDPLGVGGSDSGQPTSLPRITGSWNASVTLAGPSPNRGDTVRGMCTVDDFRITLSSPTSRDHYQGSHTGFTITCEGREASATEVFGISDTVIVVAPGSVTGVVWELISDPVFQVDGATWQTFGGSLTSQNLGGAFWWKDSSDAIRIWAKFDAFR